MDQGKDIIIEILKKLNLFGALDYNAAKELAYLADVKIKAFVNLSQWI